MDRNLFNGGEIRGRGRIVEVGHSCNHSHSLRNFSMINSLSILNIQRLVALSSSLCEVAGQLLKENRF